MGGINTVYVAVTNSFMKLGNIPNVHGITGERLPKRKTREKHEIRHHLPCQMECHISSGWMEISASSCGEGMHRSLVNYQGRSLQRWKE